MYYDTYIEMAALTGASSDPGDGCTNEYENSND